MTSISPLSSSSTYAIWPVSGAVANTAPTAAPSDVQPSTIVALGVAANPAAATYAPAKTIWQYDNRDAVSGQMAKNIQATSSSGRLKGLGASLLQRFATDPSDFSQMVRLTHGNSMLPAFRSTLQVKTTGGAEVTLTLDSKPDSLAVAISSKAELSDKERAAIADLAQGLQQALDGLAGEQPKLDLSGLLRYDTRQLSSVDFQTTIKKKDGPETQFALHVDSETRSLKVDGPGGKVQLSVDIRQAQLWGDQTQQATSIDNYLKQFDHAAARGQANPALLQVLKDGFSQLNRNDNKAAGFGALPTFNEQDHAMLTGIADFTASVIATPTQPNSKRHDEWKTFSYQASQRTEIDDKDVPERHVVQTQQAHLNAKFHTAIPGQQLDFQTQTYIYNQIDDSAHSRTEFAYHNARLAQALVQQSANQSTHQQEYVRGDRVRDETIPTFRTRELNLLPLFIEDAHEDAKKTAAERAAQHAQRLRLAHTLIQLQLSPAALDTTKQSAEAAV